MYQNHVMNIKIEYLLPSNKITMMQFVKSGSHYNHNQRRNINKQLTFFKFNKILPILMMYIIIHYKKIIIYSCASTCIITDCIRITIGRFCRLSLNKLFQVKNNNGEVYVHLFRSKFNIDGIYMLKRFNRQNFLF